MAEMHLDLCIQSTSHLLATMSSIKDNIRMLEVFLNSGLNTVDFGGPVSYVGEDYLSSLGSRKSTDSMEKPYFQRTMSYTDKRHLNCCCMCRYRLTGRAENFTGSESRASTATASLHSNSNKSERKSAQILLPRLNRTASLRRDLVQQRLSRK